MLELLGDVGGLLDGLKLIAGFLIAPIAALALKTVLLSEVFRLIPARKTGTS